MSDNITLPRADAEQIRDALASGKRLYAALAALDAALAEPDAKREPATDEQAEAMMPQPVPSLAVLDGFRMGWHAAERFHGIGGRERQPPATGMLGAEADKVLTDEIGWQPCRYPACVDDSGRCARLFAGECAGPNGEKRGAALKVKEDKT